MSLNSVKQELLKIAPDLQIIEYKTSTASVEEAALAHKVEPGKIVKTLALMLEKPILLMTSGNVKIDNKKYKDRLRDARKKTGQDDAILIAKGKIKNIDVIVGAQDFRFIGGSFGAASGEAFITAVQHSINNKNPLIFFSCSGGQRMMESSIALMQMTRTVLAVNELKKNNLPYIVVMTNPTTGGVSASFATLGDILIGEPKSVIAFAGRRVIQNTVKEELPEDFQTAEFVRDHGGIDLVIERKYLRSTISTLISILLKKKEVQNISEMNDATDLSDTLQKTSKAV